METIQIELGLLIGTGIFFAGLWFNDELERIKKQKMIDSVQYRFIDSACFHKIFCNCRTKEEVEHLLSRYKDR